MSVSIKGIDVSKWQGDIDWKKVADADVKFAMVRLGYGSSTGASCGIDSYFAKNVEGALLNDIPVGCYFYSYGLTVEAVKKEAEFVVKQLDKYKGRLLYPVAYDIEDSSQKSLGKKALTEMVKTFCETIENAGYYAAFYSNPDWAKNRLNIKELEKFDFWLAQWSSVPTYKDRSYNMWQYTSSGSVNGIKGRVDMNISYVDFESVIKSKKLNGYTGFEAKPVSPAKPAETLAFKVGDEVYFNGGPHYSKANGTASSAIPKAGSAKVTAISKGAAHPYHLIHSDSQSTVYGWVDSKNVSSLAIDKNDIVEIIGTKYYNGVTIPAWVKKLKWVVYSESGNRVVVNKSEDGKKSIMSAVSRADLKLVKKL